MKIFMLAGENSGDALGGPLIEALKAEQSDIEIEGIGGPLMEAAGLDSILPMDELNIMGIWEVIAQLPRLLNLINGVVEEVEARQPDIYLGVDFPDFNFAVAKRLKKRGIYKGKIYHYVAPTVWAWRPGRAKKIAQFLDGLFCLFPFEPDYFKPHGLEAYYIGHSLIERDLAALDPNGFKQALRITEGAPVCGLFFGSRPKEIAAMGQVIVETAVYLSERIKDIQFIIPTLPEIEYEVRAALEGLKAPHYIIMDPQQKYDAFVACDTAIAVSGTVGLELAYLNVPHIIGYKTNVLSYGIAKALVKTPYIHLANILLQKPAVQEYIQLGCKSEVMAEKLYTLMKDEKSAAQQQSEFDILRQKMNSDIEISPSVTAAKKLLA